MAKEFINPEGLASPRGYTQVVTAPGGKLVFVSGQVALDAAGKLVGPGDLRAQATKTYENLITALRAAGARPDDVLKMTVYVVNYKPEHLAVIREVRGRSFPREDRMPASTLVGVQALAFEGLLIEVEAIAVVE